MKKFLAFLVFLISTACFGQGQYNIIATAYVQTTLSQIVVLSPAQQAAGNFTFSIDAHNGGGRAGQSDTASVKIQFYNSSNTLLYTASSSNYSLPNPNAVCGNPCIDPAVPWTNMTVSSANCGSSCSAVAYVKVIATGIDGSYWAGDYGPWYKNPVLTVNGSGNILYNPEFGPSPNNVTAQGWSVSPAFGACQGAWGGSNACIVNSSGVPGTSTTGVTANMNGGGYIATAGTTSAPAGGTTQTVPGANNLYNLKFGRYQIADSQWNTSACLTTNTCQIYYKDPGVLYQIPWTSGQWTWQTGQYVKFSASGDANYPYTATVYNADGTVAGVIGTGKIVNMGTDFFFFVGNDDNTGALFSMTSGMSDTSGVTWTGTVNPTDSQVNTYAAGGSTTPLAAGQSTAPTVVSTSTSNSVSTSTSSSSSNTGSVSVDKTTNGGGTISTTTNTYVGTTTTTVTTTTTTPVTTTTYSDGTTSTSNGTPTTSSSSSTTYTITPTLGIAPIYSAASPNTSGNSIYIKQVYSWASTQVSVTQEGNNNAVTGTDSGWATVDGNGSIISIKQYGQGNIVGTKMNAWGNNIDIKQQAANGGDVNNNILMFDSHGNGNSSTVQQQSNSNTASIKMTYDINTVNITQKTGTGNASYNVINGNWNTINNTQNGSDNFSLINISGDNNSATVNQTGNNHSTLLNLIGNKNTVSVTQTGVGDTYSLQQTCTNPAGCSVSVIRNK
jgi:Curlin associated repeat